MSKSDKPQRSDQDKHLVVDAMNVIGSRPDGWWKDRAGAVRKLIEDLQDLGAEVTVVVDGRPSSELPEGRHGTVEVLYAARRGPNAADDRIVDLVSAAAEPAALEVVTADRGLRERLEALGATVSRPSRLLHRLGR